MTKIAIFVEGHTELIFVKQLLLLYYNWNVDIQCNELLAGNLISANFDNPAPDAGVHYRIVCVGNDTLVLSAILKREKYLRSSGYQRVIGLRDMYCADFCEECGSVDLEVIKKFISTTRKTIVDRAIDSASIAFCYAIMEVECWLVALDIFEKIDERLNTVAVEKVLGFTPRADVMEKTILKPADELARVYGHVGMSYDKAQKTVTSFCSHIAMEDVDRLIAGAYCRSFNYFYSKLF